MIRVYKKVLVAAILLLNQQSFAMGPYLRGAEVLITLGDVVKAGSRYDNRNTGMFIPVKERFLHSYIDSQKKLFALGIATPVGGFSREDLAKLAKLQTETMHCARTCMLVGASLEDLAVARQVAEWKGADRTPAEILAILRRAGASKIELDLAKVFAESHGLE